MMKRLIALLLAAVLALGCCQTAFAAKKKNPQMNDDVPVWDEDTVRQYALDYVQGTSMSRLWGYYDLQIRRYMPLETYESLLVNLEWMTGEFVGLGTYRSFEEPDLQLKTHVLHLCMEKQDLDMYFTHKNKEDDWEVMALEFVPAEKQNYYDESNMLVDEEFTQKYTETPVTIGDSQAPLKGVLTMPDTASADQPVPACVLLQDEGGLDMDSTLGQTRFFADLADAFANMGIATIRFDTRVYTYPDSVFETMMDEMGNDALDAIRQLSQDSRISGIVLLAHGISAKFAPRIAAESDGAVQAMILLGGAPQTLLDLDYNRYKSTIDEADLKTVQNAVRKMDRMKEADARKLTLFGHNGYYYWDLAQNDPIKLLKKLKLPTYIVQGRNDPIVSDEKGRQAYIDELGLNSTFADFKAYRGLNHILMNDLSTNDQGVPEYQFATTLDRLAGRNLAQWILALYSETEE